MDNSPSWYKVKYKGVVYNLHDQDVTPLIDAVLVTLTDEQCIKKHGRDNAARHLRDVFHSHDFDLPPNVKEGDDEGFCKYVLERLKNSFDAEDHIVQGVGKRVEALGAEGSAPREEKSEGGGPGDPGVRP